MNKKAVIFDMDGTLADTWTVGIELAREMQVLGPDMMDTDIQRLRDMPVTAIMKELKIPLRRVPGLLVKGRAELTKRITQVLLFPKMKDVLSALEKQDFDLYVMSSNSLVNVQKFLQNAGIEQHFKDVQGGVGVFAKTKSLKKLLKKHKINKADAVYVGDEVRDVEAAKRAGIQSIAVTWGLNGEKILRSYNPTFLAHTPKELERAVEDWSKQ